MLECIEDGAVNLYYDSSKKFETISTGIAVTGDVGIGTASPSYKLDVQGTPSPRIRVAETTSDTATTMVEVENSDGRGAMLGIGGSGRTDILSNRGYIHAQAATDGLAIGTEDTDPIVFYTQGVDTTDEKMRIDSAGNVGIGSDTPTAKLQLKNTAADSVTQIAFTNDARTYNAGIHGGLSDSFNIYDITAGATRFLIDSSGNVGIGTTNPTALLQLESTSAGAATVAGFLVNSSTTLNTETRLAFAAHTNSDIATDRYSYISALNSSGSNGQDMIFATNATGAGGTERLRITSAGQVNLLNTTSTDSKHFGITNAAGTTGWTFGNGVIANSHQFVIYDNTAGATRMLIDSSGDIGIGGTPASKLDVHAASGDGIRVANTTSSAYNSDLIVNFNDVSTMQLRCLGTSILQAGNTGNTVLSTRTDKDIDIDPSGTGVINLKSNIAITGEYTDQNGVRTFRKGGIMVNNSAYTIDITVDDDTGTGTVHHITAMMTHYDTTYGCVLECYAYTRGTGVNSQTDLLNQSNAAAGGWTVSKPDTTTLRLTKTAGTYTGAGNYQVVVVTSTPT
jgi:hypothetical protein